MCQHKFNGNHTCVLCGLVGGQVLVSGYIPFRKHREVEITNADLQTGTIYRYHDKMLGSLETHASMKVRQFRVAFFEMDKLAERLQLSKGTQEEIAFLWRRLRKGGHNNGRETLQLLGGLAWIVCRLRRIPRTLNEINRAVEELGGKGVNAHVLNFLATTLTVKPPRAKPTDYLHRFASQVGLTAEETRRAFELSHKGNGGRPDIVAGALCYLASDKTLRETGDKLNLHLGVLSINVRKIKNRV